MSKVIIDTELLNGDTNMVVRQICDGPGITYRRCRKGSFFGFRYGGIACLNDDTSYKILIIGQEFMTVLDFNRNLREMNEAMARLEYAKSWKYDLVISESFKFYTTGGDPE